MSQLTPPAERVQRLHVDAWPSGELWLLDLDHVRRRGHSCRVALFVGTIWSQCRMGDYASAAAVQYTEEALRLAQSWGPDTPFDAARSALLDLVDQARRAGIPPDRLAIYDQELLRAA